MRTEIPECKRCCFCLPLRYSLITWGYIRLVISACYCLGLSILFFGLLDSPRGIYTLLVWLGCCIIFTLTDIVLNAIFIVGGHTKNLRFLKAYYVYSFVLCVLTSLLAVSLCVYMLYMYSHSEMEVMFYVYVFLMDATFLLALILIQIYVILLVRSEILKLKSNCEFRFVNLAAEPECTMKYEHPIPCEEDHDPCERNDAENLGK